MLAFGSVLSDKEERPPPFGRPKYRMNPNQSELTPEQLAVLQSSKLFNADLSPVPPSQRRWRVGPKLIRTIQRKWSDARPLRELWLS